MASVHTLIAEVTANLIYTFETTYNQTLQVQLCGNTKIEIHIQGIMVGDEWTSRRTTCNLLKDRSFHFRETCLIKYLTHGAENGGTLQESVLHSIIDNQIHITLTVSQFWVFKSIKHLTILLLHHWQWLQTLCQHGERLGMNTDFSSLSTEHKTLHTDEVTQIEQLLKHHII